LFSSMSRTWRPSQSASAMSFVTTKSVVCRSTTLSGGQGRKMSLTTSLDRAGRGEFAVRDARTLDRRSPLRWVLSHLAVYWPLVVLCIVCALATNILFSLIPTYPGRAFDEVLSGGADRAVLLRIALTILGLVVVRAV